MLPNINNDYKNINYNVDRPNSIFTNYNNESESDNE